MRHPVKVERLMPRKRNLFLHLVYGVATVQFAWCYLWLTRPYVNTAQYELGLERMPFQGRILMMWPMRWAHESRLMQWLTEPFGLSRFWFPRPVAPEVLVQAAVNVACLLVTGWMTAKIYEASSKTRLLTPLVYPLLLTTAAATYMMHTVQNFRFIYDFPSLAFFATAMFLIYFRKHWGYFVALFAVATINRETTLLLLPLYMLNGAVEDGRLRWPLLFRRRTMLVVAPLALAWTGWQILIHQMFAGNVSEFYPRFDWNIKSLLSPQAWPQLLSACGYLMLIVVVMRRRIADARLRAWLWILAPWLMFMFVFGILVETRVFGELIPFVVCATTMILEETVLIRMNRVAPVADLNRPKPVAMRSAA
jgi:hypothetical protein